MPGGSRSCNNKAVVPTGKLDDSTLCYTKDDIKIKQGTEKKPSYPISLIAKITEAT